MNKIVVMLGLLWVTNSLLAKGQDSYQRCFDKAMSTHAMRQCQSIEMDKRKTELKQLYQKLLRQREESKDKQLLKLAQKRFKQYRKAECRFMGLENKGGSLEPVVIAGCYIDLTKARIKRLRYHLRSRKENI